MPVIMTFNGISLVDITGAPLWVDRHQWSPVAQAARRVLGGREYTQFNSIVAGQPITLESDRNQGWVNWLTFKQLKPLADVAGATYSFQVESDIYTVMLRHEDPPAISWEPFIRRTTPLDADYGMLRLKLKTV